MVLVPAGTLRDMGAFFTKAALFTFGGTYAVLPYVYQGGVEHYGWLTGSQMIDGLALSETTPGPLIMVVAFVGFIGASTQEVFGPDLPLLAGIAGAGVATFFTFLPSFLFILCGAPLAEATHGDLKFTAPLTAITAAVVGVVVNLAVFFAWHALWPAGTDAALHGRVPVVRGGGFGDRLRGPAEVQARRPRGDRGLRGPRALPHLRYRMSDGFVRHPEALNPPRTWPGSALTALARTPGSSDATVPVAN